MVDPQTRSESPPEKKIKRVIRPHQDVPRHQDHTNSVSSNQNHGVNHLPADIIENIFTFLPIKEAVQIGTVSTRFVKSWVFNRNLLFGREFALRYNREDLSALIDRVFESHKGPKIQSFSLYIDPEGMESLIEKWVRICVRKGIEELDFNFLQPTFMLGSDLTDIQTLKNLKLTNCEIELPPVMTGLRHLHNLILRQLVLTEEKLENLVFYCKFLGTLDLCQCSGIRQVNIFAREHRQFKTLKIASCCDVEGIEIDALTLRSVFYCGFIIKIQFTQALRLNEAIFNFLPARARGYIQAHELESLVTDLFHVSVLTTSAPFPEALTARIRDGVFKGMQFCLWNLRELQLFMEGATFCNAYDIAVFLKGCPFLETLFIDLNDYEFECGLYWKLHQKPMLDNFDHFFNRLRIIKLKGFKFHPSELELVKLLLQKSIFLEAFIFITPRNGRTKLYPPDAVIYNQLFHSWKASPTAKILLFEHFSDKSFIHPTHPKYWY